MSSLQKQIKVNNHLLMKEITALFNAGRESVTFTVRGYSMRPFLEHERDKVVLVPPRTPHIGDVVLAEVGKERYALHRVIATDGKRYIMRGDGNPLKMKECFTEENMIGVAKAFIRKGKTVETGSLSWKFYSATWESLKPFRRILLAIYRRIK